MKTLVEWEQTARQLPQDLVDAGQKVVLAGVGVMSVVGNTTGTMFGSLVDEGKQFQKDHVDKVVTKTNQSVKEAVDHAWSFVQENVQKATKSTLNRLGVPSRGDVSDLSARVEALTAKLEALTRKGSVDAH